MCVLVTVLNFAALMKLDRKCEGPQRYIISAYWCWTLAWIAWVALWYVAYILGSDNAKLTILILSDVNTTFLTLFYLGMTRGRVFTPMRYFISGGLLAIIFTVVELAIYALGHSELSFNMHQNFSMAASMFTPLLVGWALRRRFGSATALAFGSAYAFAQLPAYAALFGTFGGDESQTAIMVVAVLALLKIMFAAPVLQIPGRDIESTESLVCEVPERRRPAPDAFWLPVTAIGIGVIAFAVWLWQTNGGLAQSGLATLGLTLGAIAATIKIVEYLERRFRK